MILYATPAPQPSITRLLNILLTSVWGLDQLLQVLVIKHEVQCNAGQGRTGNKQGYPAIIIGNFCYREKQ